MLLSLVVPVKDRNDPKLASLLRSIDEQDFDKNEMETILVTEGTSESAKAIGIRKAQGKIIGILASDNVLTSRYLLKVMQWEAAYRGASYPLYYTYDRKDDILNRYFALMGCNDPLAFYMAKCDRLPHVVMGPQWPRTVRYEADFKPEGTTLGDNGYFVRKDLIEQTDLDNYYHIDNANEACIPHPSSQDGLKHNTGGNLFSFFKKRYQYGLQHAFNPNRRWHLVDFSKPKDIRRFIWFIIAGITLLPTLFLSIRGYWKIRDIAWFLHPLVCLGTLSVYGVLICHLFLRQLFQSLSAPMVARRA